MKKYIVFLFVFAAVTGASASGIMAEEELTHESSAESTVEIEFEEGNADVDPLDPDDPTISVNGGTDEGGSLALNFVSPFYFEQQVVSPTQEEYPTTTARPYIQVTDVRGTGAGWEVYAQASAFKDSSDEPSLKGASVTFADASLETTTTDVDDPTPADTFTLPADGATTRKVVEANQMTGMGTWLIRWYKTGAPALNDSVKLIVPGGSGMLGRNTAKITWYLTLGPVS